MGIKECKSHSNAKYIFKYTKHSKSLPHLILQYFSKFYNTLQHLKKHYHYSTCKPWHRYFVGCVAMDCWILDHWNFFFFLSFGLWFGLGKQGWVLGCFSGHDGCRDKSGSLVLVLVGLVLGFGDCQLVASAGAGGFGFRFGACHG